MEESQTPDVYGDYSEFYDLYVGHRQIDLPFYLEYAKRAETQSIVRLTRKMLSSKSLVIGPSQTPVEAIFAQVLLRWLLEMNYGYTRKFQTLEFR